MDGVTIDWVEENYPGKVISKFIGTSNGVLIYSIEMPEELSSKLLNREVVTLIIQDANMVGEVLDMRFLDQKTVQYTVGLTPPGPFNK